MQQQARITFDNVSVEYPTATGSMLAVDNVTLDIRQGEFVSLIGPSGCGKTTIMNCVAGFVEPARGTVLLDGKSISGPGPDRGVMFQDYGVFPWLTVEDNIEFGLKLRANHRPKNERKEISRRYMELMGLTDFGTAFPKTLSGGMRQRLALARTYAVQPEFLLMDEPFGALDAQTRTAMQMLLLDVLRAESKTVMMITHSVEEALLLSSRIVVITARPARVRRIIDIPFDYPRDITIQERPEFIELHAELREIVMREYAEQQRQKLN